MKARYLYSIIVSSILFISCNNDILPEDRDNNLSANSIRIESVEQNDFEANQTTRSSYIGYATKFENGDKLGLILTNKDGKQLANIPFSYTENGWTNDNAQPYSSGINKIIAYYPYNEELSNEVTSLDQLKETVTIVSDQSSVEDLKRMDLLVYEIENPSANLNIQFKHAFSMIALSAISTLTVGEETFDYNVEMSNVSLSIGEAMYTLCSINGTYVCLIKDKSLLQEDEFRYFYTISDKAAVKTVNQDIITSSGKRYTFPCTVSGSEEISPAIGDFYCVSNSSNNIIIIPGKAASIPTGLTCKGIVFHIMKDFGDFCTLNNLISTGYPGYNEKHGLIVSSMNGELFGMSNDNKDIVTSVFSATSIDDYNNTNVSNGYKLTKVLKEAAEDESSGLSFTALDNHTELLTNTTIWYAPSFNELKYMIRGIQSDVVSTNGQEYINKQLNKIGGTEITGNIPSITFNDGFYLMENGTEMGWHGIPGAETYRPICAF
ncbi:fimbrillin family protein [Bacteroides difficilis]|uniref:fimbrillin family protein n=1 Tax=Bacteroides difficilis TaxID=2763021 RepID=UPI003AADBF04